jgi:cytochrome c oxidase subunit II
MPLAVVLVLLVVGSILFHLFSPWTFTPLASNWSMVDFTVDITLWVTGFVFVSVNLFMAYSVYKYRHKKGARATYEPENKKLETWLTVLTAVGVAAMLTPGLFVWGRFVQVPDGAMVVEAIGQQWHWTYRYPGADGKFGEVDAERISEDNPFGMDPEDPHGQDDVLVYNPEAHIPLGRPVKFLLRSKDVLHDFAVAQFRVKMDLVPGMQTFLWLTPTKTGRFEVLCEELCGIAHFAMRGAVVVDERDDFDQWLAKQPTYAEEVAAKPADPKLGATSYTVCATCHGQQGQGEVAMNAPKLAGQSPWYLKHQLQNFKAGIRGAHAGDVFGQQMAAMAATLVDAAAIDNVVAYIGTLPDEPAPATITGDVDNGRKHYAVCAYCHGADGHGIRATNAPRTAGMSDWYLERQIHNFKQGIRGSHPQDYYGFQMEMMANSVVDDQTVEDIIAYINTL